MPTSSAPISALNDRIVGALGDDSLLGETGNDSLDGGVRTTRWMAASA
ncbi:MAG: hypothetical protein HZT43_10130 [Exiguobacterium profundum]|nr:MAG: hypothetical protein HZT43_10130 [Exiguobacterium profundum]